MPEVKLADDLFPDAAARPMRVRVVDIDMPFWSMTGFMVKWAIATIPAILLIVALGALLMTFLSSLLGLTY